MTALSRAIARDCPVCLAHADAPCRWGASRDVSQRVHLYRLSPEDRPPMPDRFTVEREDPRGYAAARADEGR